MPDIKVLKIEQKNSEKYGNTKILHVEDGSKWNVRDSKPFYESVVGPGIYYVEFKEYQGKQYISFLRFKSALEGSNQAVASISAVGGSGSSSTNSYDANAKARLAADKRRQDDIRLEFYCNVAKDILIANKKEGVDIDYKDVLSIGAVMYKQHLDTINLLTFQEGKMQLDKKYTEPGKNKAIEAEKEQKRLEEEEPNFDVY